MNSVLGSLKLETGAKKGGEGWETHKEKKTISSSNNLSQIVEILINTSKESWPGNFPKQQIIGKIVLFPAHRK